MVRRSDALPFPTEAQVNASLCVSCGICVGSCPSSTPYRRSVELVTGIDLPDYPLRELRERTIAAAASLRDGARVLVLACEHGGGAGHREGVVTLPCVAMAPPSLIDFVLGKGLADGIVVAGCAESACYHRLGVAWTEQRFAGERDPYLRTRVPRARIKTIWASALETQRFADELAQFAGEVERLGPLPAGPHSAVAAASTRPDDASREPAGAAS